VYSKFVKIKRFLIQKGFLRCSCDCCVEAARENRICCNLYPELKSRMKRDHQNCILQVSDIQQIIGTKATVSKYEILTKCVVPRVFGFSHDVKKLDKGAERR